mgnify:FL=1
MKVKVHRTLYIFGGSVHTERKRRVWHERKYRAFEFYYQNSQMGVDTVRQLMDITENADFQKLLSEHLEGYQKVHEKAWRMLNENGYDEKG